MKTLVLKRRTEPAEGTLGEFEQLGIFTLEPPWLGNLPNRSCIPAGSYPMSFGYSPKLNHPAWHIDVPNRSGILIHKGNYLYDTHGCILVGKDWLVSAAGELTVKQSAQAYEELVLYLGSDKWELKVEGGE